VTSRNTVKTIISKALEAMCLVNRLCKPEGLYKTTQLYLCVVVMKEERIAVVRY
jgi:hypothetical protein